MNTPARYPRTLQRFRNLPGPYGVLEVLAKNSQSVALTLTQEYVELNRQDAQELIRVLSAWLAGPVVDTQVLRTHGADSQVVIVDDGAGTPAVVVIDGERPPLQESRHFDRPTDGAPRTFEEEMRDAHLRIPRDPRSPT